MIIENGSNGIVAMNSNSNLTLNDSVLKGAFGGSGIRITGTNIVFSGTGNTVEAGTTFADTFCNNFGTVTGTLAFDIGNCP